MSHHRRAQALAFVFLSAVPAVKARESSVGSFTGGPNGQAMSWKSSTSVDSHERDNDRRPLDSKQRLSDNTLERPRLLTVQCDNTTDCTEPLQAALNDHEVDVVFVPGREAVWPTRPLFLNRSGVELRLGAGAVLQARRGFYHGTDDMLLTIKGAANVMITGDGVSSAIRMWRIDYRNSSLYSKAEWRHGIGVYDTVSLTMSGFTIAETGGDGIYLNAVSGVLIRNITTVGAYRNGLSVISASNLVVEDTAFVNTGAQGRWNGGDTLNATNGGTSPRAGVDLEPNERTQKLENITFRRVLAMGNADNAFDISTDISPSITITFEDCEARDCAGWGSGFYFAQMQGRGSVTIQNSRIMDMGGAGINVQNKGGDVANSFTSIIIRNVTMTGVAEDYGGMWPPHSRNASLQGFFPLTMSASNALPNNIELDNVTVVDVESSNKSGGRGAAGSAGTAAGRPFIGCQAPGPNGFAVSPCTFAISNLHGTVNVLAVNHSVCSTARLGKAASNLKVTCGMPSMVLERLQTANDGNHNH